MQGKTALVLSAGGMFGAYQAGAYEEIVRHADIDMVVGASVGALNGWVIASGCRPEYLAERWMTPEIASVLQLYPNAGLRNGWFDPRPLRAITQDLYDSHTPTMPFGLVVVDVPRFRTHLVQHPLVRPEHLQATCSIPMFLPTVRIDGRRYLDGGLFEKLPLAAALEMGATRIIAIDSLPEIAPPWIRMGFRVARRMKASAPLPENFDLTVISASERMGTAHDAVFWTAANASRWIELGRRDARKVLSSVETSMSNPGLVAVEPVSQNRHL